MPIISDDTNEFEERATLTQRRQMGSSGVSKLNRAKLEPSTSPTSKDKDEESGGGQTGKIVIWVVAVVTLAVAAYFGVKSFSSKPAVTPTPTLTPAVTVAPTQTLAEQVLTNTVLPDSQAPNAVAASLYNTNNQQVGKASTAEYTIESVSVQKYATFTRFNFTISGVATTPTANGTIEPFPVIAATYDKTANTISLLFNQIGSNATPFTTTEYVSLGTPSISKISYDTSLSASQNQERYIITLNTQAKYYMQTVTASNLVTVDVADVKPVATTTTAVTPTVSVTSAVTPTVRPTTTGAVVTPTVAPTSTTGNSTSYSKGDQAITSSLTTNTFSLVGGYTYDASGGVFTYQKTLSNTSIPNVSASLSGTTLTVRISNYNVANSGAQTINFNANGIVTKLEASVTNHVLTYVFTLVRESNYRIAFDTTAMTMKIQVKP